MTANVTVVEPNAPTTDSAEMGRAAGALPAAWPISAGNFIASSPADPGALATAPPAEAPPESAIPELERYLAEVTEAAPPATSGRYRSPAVGFQLELRVDIDGRRPLMKLSGDYFQTSGSTTTYFGSWTVDAVTTSTVGNAVVAVGTARTSWQTTFTVARVTIPQRTIVQPAAPATIQWLTPSGTPGATYVCAHESHLLRTVELEQDTEAGVTPFNNYDTGSLPSGGPARVLDVAAAYSEAGIQMLDSGGTNTITTLPTHIWNNASLHNAMVAHFSRYAERPQFKVWLLHAREHELTASQGVIGIMFDQQGLQRQGCASFYGTIEPPTLPNRRTQLYLNVHELGHCFNLFHSFHKQFMNPPLPNRLGALSWMNYPQNYRPGNGQLGGSAAFWGAFAFQFDDLELAHVRHGFRNNVIMGGTPFGQGAALEMPVQPDDPVWDTSGLQLRIGSATRRPIIGTPIVLDIALAAERGQMVHSAEQLHPKYGVVQVMVSRPRGDVVVHRPPVLHCAEPDLARAGSGEILPVSAYIGYDAAVGQLFEDPGTYRLRATYISPEGSVIVSNSAMVRVWGAQDAEDAEVAELMLRDETGMALTLLGSDSEYLRRGTEALREVAQEHTDHPTAVYAQLALGINAARPFTAVEPDGSVQERPRDLDRADQLLTRAIDASRGTGGLDDLTVYQAMAYLAGSHAAEGEAGRARELRQDAAQLARSKDAPDSVIAALEADTSD